MAKQPVFIAFEGGGALGVAHLGAWQEVADHYSIIGTSGTSAGAIVAALCAAGYPPGHAIQLFNALKWPEYVNLQNWFKLLTNRNAWSDGGRFYKWLQEQLPVHLPGKPHRVTFASLYELTKIYLAVVACDLNDEQARPKVFDKDAEYDTSVAFAVRASMSIPGVFVPVPRLSKDQELVDGGVLLNYPVKLIQDKAQEANCPFIGVRFDRPLAHLEAPKVGATLKRTVELMLRRGSLAPEELAHDPNYIEIVINTNGFKSSDFGMSRQRKQELVQRGAHAAMLALKDYDVRIARSSSMQQVSLSPSPSANILPLEPSPVLLSHSDLSTHGQSQTSLGIPSMNISEKRGEGSPPLDLNVFYFNGPLLDHIEFYGRQRQRSTLIDRTRNKASTSIVGPHSIGKTWLVKYLRMVAFSRLGSRYFFVELDATAHSIATVTDFSTRVIKGLGHSPSPHAGLVELEDVIEHLEQDHKIPVLCIDGFEGFQHHRQEFDEDFFRGLRAITRRGLVLVLASKRPLSDIIGNVGVTSGFFNIFEEIQLEPFGYEDAEEFVHNKAEKAQFTDKECALLLHYGCEYEAGGVRHWPPLRLQLVGKMLLEDKVHQRCNPDNLEYIKIFEQELKQKYEAVIR